jgi:hypothetical protein
MGKGCPVPPPSSSSLPPPHPPARCLLALTGSVIASRCGGAFIALDTSDSRMLLSCHTRASRAPADSGSEEGVKGAPSPQQAVSEEEGEGRGEYHGGLDLEVRERRARRQGEQGGCVPLLYDTHTP